MKRYNFNIYVIFVLTICLKLFNFIIYYVFKSSFGENILFLCVVVFILENKREII